MIRLQWVKYPDGFIVVRDRPPPDVTRFDEEAEKFEEVRTASWLAPRNPNRRKTYIAEGIDQHIFLDLANVGRTDPMDESVLAFTDKWGLLDDYHYHPFPVRLSVWSAAKRLHRLVDRV